jgi:hypothetical protein
VEEVLEQVVSIPFLAVLVKEEVRRKFGEKFVCFSLEAH